MDDQRTRSRGAVRSRYGHPWPWTVEALLREEFERADGDLGHLADRFQCHPKTVDKWVRRFGLRDG